MNGVIDGVGGPRDDLFVSLAARKSKATGLAKDSAANVSQILTLDRELITKCAGKVSRARVQLILAGLDVVPGR